MEHLSPLLNRKRVATIIEVATQIRGGKVQNR